MDTKVLLTNIQNDSFYGEYCKSYKRGVSQSGNTFADAVSKAGSLEQQIKYYLRWNILRIHIRVGRRNRLRTE